MRNLEENHHVSHEFADNVLYLVKKKGCFPMTTGMAFKFKESLLSKDKFYKTYKFFKRNYANKRSKNASDADRERRKEYMKN